MTPSLEFLKLGTFDALYTYFPPVATHVLKVTQGEGGRGQGRGPWTAG